MCLRYLPGAVPGWGENLNHKEPRPPRWRSGSDGTSPVVPADSFQESDNKRGGVRYGNTENRVNSGCTKLAPSCAVRRVRCLYHTTEEEFTSEQRLYSMDCSKAI